MNYYLCQQQETRSQRNSRLRRERLDAARAKASHTPEQWNSLVEQFQERCVQCGSSSARLQKDHILPLYQGGSDGIENLQPLCGSCNASKGPSSFNWAAYRLQNGFSDL